MRTSTTWTMGRVLDSVRAGGEHVVVYAGGHCFEGTVQAVGEYLVTLQQGADVLVVDLAAITGLKVCEESPIPTETYVELLEAGVATTGAGVPV